MVKLSVTVFWGGRLIFNVWSSELVTNTEFQCLYECFNLINALIPGFWWYYSWTRWLYGPIWLPVVNGYLCPCVSYQLYQVCDCLLTNKCLVFNSSAFKFGITETCLIRFCYSCWTVLSYFCIHSTRAVSPGKMVQLIMALKPEEQVQVFNMLKETLTKRGLLVLK